MAGEPESDRSAEGAPLGAVLAIAISVALAPVLLLMAPVLAVFPDVNPLGPVLESQHQDAETALFAAALLVFLPGAAFLGPRIADRLVDGPNGDQIGSIAAIVVNGLAVGLLVVSVLRGTPLGGGVVALMVVIAIWGVLALALFVFVMSRPIRLPDEPIIWWTGAALIFASFLSFARLGSVTVVVLVAALVLSAGLVYAYDQLVPNPVSRNVGRTVDVGLLVLLVLAVPNLVIFRTGGLDAAFETQIVHFHQDLFLGPASHVVGGGPILTETFSQYGVLSILFIAGWFELVGVISNGMLGLLEGILSAALFAGAYCVLRAVGVSRVQAGIALLVGVLVLVFGLDYPIGGLLQHGAIRFGMPMLVLIGLAFDLRGRHAGLGTLVQVLAIGISSVWSFETFAYTLFTFLVVVGAEAAMETTGARGRAVARSLGLGFASIVAAQLVFAIATRLATDQFPDWGVYLSTLREFLFGSIGELNYDFSAWSPGLGLGASYIASALAFWLVVRRCPAIAAGQRPKLLMIAGCTGYGIALFTYLVNRSSDHIVPYVALPALMAAVLWLSILLDRDNQVARPIRLAALSLVLGLASILIAVSWSGMGLRLSQSAIAFVVPGGESLGSAVSRLHDMPPIDPDAGIAQNLLEAKMPGERESLVLLPNDLGIEALARTARVNRLPLSDPWEDSLVPELRLDDLDETIDSIRPGTRALVSDHGIALAKKLRKSPPVSLYDWTEWSVSGFAPLQLHAIQQLAQRFQFKTGDRGGGGLMVIKLEPRTPGP